MDNKEVCNNDTSSNTENLTNNTKKEANMPDNKNKLFILDTNVLIVDPSCIYKFEGHDIGIPMMVLEELDHIKSGDRSISRDARVAVRNIAGLVAEGDFKKGVPTTGGGTLKVLLDAVDNDLDNSVNDNVIINTALYSQHYHIKEYKEIVLVTNDINMRVKANAAGVIHVQDYKSDKVVEDSDYLTKGWFRLQEGWLANIPIEEIESKSCGGVVIPIKYFPEGITIYDAINTWLFEEDTDFVAMVYEVYEHQEDLSQSKLGILVKSKKTMMKRSCVGIKPRSVQQAIVFDAILAREVDVVVIAAPAGSGKTLCAVAGATEMIKGKKKGYRYNELIFTKTSDSQFAEIGFLPGSEVEKLTPWAGAVYDNMEVIWRESKREELHPLAAIESEEGFVKLKALNFMRGRSLNNRILLVDEAQNLNSCQLKTILSRAGEDCKVILMGNLAQIDNDYLTANNSGLTYICDKFSRWEHATVVQLESIERSRLAAFVEENFS